MRFPATALACGAALLSWGCGPWQRAMTPDALRSQLAGRVKSAPAATLVVPYELDRATMDRARDIVAGHASSSERATLLFDAMFAEWGFGLRYVPVVTITAQDALRTHEGNCLTLASALVGLARGAGLEAYFIDASLRVGEVDTDEEVIVNMGHVTAAVDTDRGTLAMDFGWHLPRSNDYRRIDDVEAVAQFYNNHGYELLDASIRQGAPIDWEGALRDFTIATEVMPEFARGWNNLGIANARLGRRAEAVRAYDRASDLDEHFAAPRMNLGVLALREGDVPRALASFDEAVTVEPKNARAHFHRGVALLRLGRTGAAITSLSYALDLDPDLARAKAALERARAQAEPSAQMPSSK